MVKFHFRVKGLQMFISSFELLGSLEANLALGQQWNFIYISVDAFYKWVDYLTVAVVSYLKITTGQD